ncbi:MAG: TolC family outer membrane protein [Alphaproteobacteria bacterium]
MPALPSMARPFVVFAVMGGVGLAASAPRAETLEAELRGLLLTHPQINAGTKALSSAEAGITKAFAPFFPNVTVSSDAGYEHDNTTTTRTASKESYEHETHSSTLRVTQSLYDGGQKASGSAISELQRDTTAFVLENTRNGAMFEGITAYVNVLRQARLIELATTSEENIKRQLHLEDSRLKGGSGQAVDVLQAETRLQLAREKRITFEGAMADAITRYIQVFDHAPEVAGMTMPTPPMNLLPTDVEDSVNVTLQESPIVLNSGMQVDISKEKQEVAYAGYLPSVDAVLEHDYSENRSAIRGPARNYTMMLKVTWNLFNGFSTDAAVRQAALDYGASQDNDIYARRKAAETTRLAWQALDTARKRMSLLENAVSIAQKVFESRKKLREAGKESVINVLDSENETYNARISYTSAECDAILAVYQLLSSIGRLSVDKINGDPNDPAMKLGSDNLQQPQKPSPSPAISEPAGLDEAFPGADTEPAPASAPVPAVDGQPMAPPTPDATSPDATSPDMGITQN